MVSMGIKGNQGKSARFDMGTSIITRDAGFTSPKRYQDQLLMYVNMDISLWRYQFDYST